jgi:hypothetical protein
MSLDNGKFLPILGLSLFSVESVRLRIRFRPHLNLADPVNLNSVVGRGLFLTQGRRDAEKKKAKSFCSALYLNGKNPSKTEKLASFGSHPIACILGFHAYIILYKHKKAMSLM